LDRRTAGNAEAGFVMTVSAWPEPPAGFVVRTAGRSVLYVAASSEQSVRARGLERWDAWRRALSSGSASSGRGMTTVVPGPSGSRWRLKSMRRGGWLAGLWRDRYLSGRRLVATLLASVEALARGVPTARPIALIVEPGPGPLTRGAMAFEEIDGAEDLAHRVVRRAATRDDLQGAIGAIRAMHDRGVSHPDLNLGNVLLRPLAGAARQAFVIDFDRAAFVPGPLPFGSRQAALRRLERSCAKLTGEPGPLGPGSENLWYELYAGDDAVLARRLAAGRWAGRVSLAVHRLGWRRNAG
jgi:hypothetical protein